jgi:hypothetical protein
VAVVAGDVIKAREDEVGKRGAQNESLLLLLLLLLLILLFFFLRRMQLREVLSNMALFTSFEGKNGSQINCSGTVATLRPLI